MMMVSWQSLWAAVKDVCLGKEYSRPEEDTEDYGNGSTWTRGRFLGEGSFGSVFLATSNSKGSMPEVMAVKSTEMWRSDTLKHERTVLSSLVGCPDVIQCFGSEITQKTDGSHVYNLLLEFASGGTLHDRIQSSKGKGLPESEVRWYTRSIVRGLYRIHRAEYVHCDMKPENILLVPTTLKGHKFKAKICDLLVPTSLKGHQFKAKICDFGLAKGAEEDRRKSEVDRKHWNGTLMYASPEAVKIGLQEPSSDIWSLGIIVLEMLTGRPAWDLEQGSGSESERVLQKLKRGSLPKIPKHLSSEARNFLKMCLRRTAKNRPTASSLCQHPFLHDDHNADSHIMPGSGVEDPVNLTRNCIPSELMPELLPETRICPV